MRLTNEALTEFRALWDTDHPDEAISDDELRRVASRLIRAVALILPDDDLSTPAA